MSDEVNRFAVMEVSLWRLTLSVYGFAIVMALMAIIPGCNLLYSAHGGPGWLLVPFSLPVALVRIYFLRRSDRYRGNERFKRFASRSLPIYVIGTFIASIAGAYSIESFLGYELSPLLLWGLFTFPFGLIVAWKWLVF